MVGVGRDTLKYFGMRIGENCRIGTEAEECMHTGISS